ncbi:uncharacterized protein Z519_01073 [Cladophialophora bantiana CBS 173.52]|uniref:Uncharacterized protein n=1 Tax=Cladophialophora bantiana (strain ATCC 10958 / CBS 173.52 / CDC B-1940 / NIH 8579) TaxID=1442370 RepID=A0A0D2IL40_CLAB1|nr:uncharacterized protein Z519_01073 [Cladophialophora bantiana CBS 173.52]KIW97489.1 hypothetical protein Z519_01073 [Cladophialophora bantiana CBS 173.52]
MSGFICLGKSKPELQIAFAALYVFLNVLYWFCSALDPTKWHWWHDYQVVTLEWKHSDSQDPSFDVVLEATMFAATLPNDDGNQAEAQRPLTRWHSSFAAFLTRRVTAERGLSPPEVEPNIQTHCGPQLHSSVTLDGCNTPVWRRIADLGSNGSKKLATSPQLGKCMTSCYRIKSPKQGMNPKMRSLQ